MDTWTVSQGTEEEFVVTISDADGDPITTYTGSESLSGKVWPGLNLAATFTPGVVWVTPADGTVKVTISSAESTAAAAGLYFIQLVLTDGSGPHVFYTGILAIRSSPASDPLPTVYCSYQDLVVYAPQSPKLLALATDDSQFLQQRGRARLRFESKILDRYRPQPGRCRRYVDETGQVAGPYLRFAEPPMGSSIPTLADLQGYFAANALLLTEDVVRANALLAASEVYLGQPGNSNPYQQLGQQAMNDSHELTCRSTIEFDTNDDGIPEIRIDRDVIFLT